MYVKKIIILLLISALTPLSFAIDSGVLTRDMLMDSISKNARGNGVNVFFSQELSAPEKGMSFILSTPLGDKEVAFEITTVLKNGQPEQLIIRPVKSIVERVDGEMTMRNINPFSESNVKPLRVYVSNDFKSIFKDSGELMTGVNLSEQRAQYLVKNILKARDNIAQKIVSYAEQWNQAEVEKHRSILENMITSNSNKAEAEVIHRTLEFRNLALLTIVTIPIVYLSSQGQTDLSFMAVGTLAGVFLYGGTFARIISHTYEAGRLKNYVAKLNKKLLEGSKIYSKDAFALEKIARAFMGQKALTCSGIFL